MKIVLPCSDGEPYNVKCVEKQLRTIAMLLIGRNYVIWGVFLTTSTVTK